MARKHPVFGGQSGSVKLLWEEAQVGRRGPRPALTVAQLVQRAIRLADTRGLSALSMEKLASEFGYTTMALYRYVPGRGALIDSTIDAALGTPPAIESTGKSWRAGLTRWAESLAEVFSRHPWSLEATGRLRVMGPCELAWLEAGMGALAPTPLTPEERHSACLALLSQVRSHAQFSAAASGKHQGLSGAQWAAATSALVETRAERYPLLRQTLSRGRSGAPLRSGLEWVLDGIAARVEHPARRRSRNPG